MRKSKNCVRLQVEVMESRALLSAVAAGPFVPVRNTIVADFGINRQARPPINSVNLKNNAGHDLIIRAFFKRDTNPNPIRHPDKVILAGRSGEFVFNKDLVGFIWIEVKRHGSPGPFNGPFYLNKPSGGYYGAPYTITFSNGTYTVG
jgi:hypothetical protein